MKPSNACEADLVLVNGKIITVDEGFSVAQRLAVKGGRVQAVGTTEEIGRLSGKSTEVIDLKGKTVMPGLYDSHLHVVGTGTALQMINCRTPPMMSIGDMKKVVAEKAEQAGSGEWIQCRGWDQAKLADHRNPTRWDLDDASPDNPVVLTRTCGHLLVANSAALRIAGVTRETLDPVGGRIVRDEKGEPTGMREESPAMNLVRLHVPPVGIPETMKAIRMACQAFNEAGITSVIDAGDTEDEMVAYQLLRGRGELRCGVNVMLRSIQEGGPGGEG